MNSRPDNDDRPSLAAMEEVSGPGDRTSVFLVHGRDRRAANAMRNLLRSMGLRIVEWSHARNSASRKTGNATPYVGEIVVAGIRMADAIVILSTPDDLVLLRPDLADRENDRSEELSQQLQARPNVLYEAGIADALALSRTVHVEVGKVKSPTDLGGRNAVRFDGGPAAVHALASRLREVGLDVDLSGEDWLTVQFEESMRSAEDWLKASREPLGSPKLSASLQHRGEKNFLLKVANVGQATLSDIYWEAPDKASDWKFSTTRIAQLKPGNHEFIQVTIPYPGLIYGVELTLFATQLDGSPFDQKVYLQHLPVR